MAIPKVIHYCWFGNGELSDEAKESLATWKKHMPDYEIVRWSEQNFDVHMNKYVSEAYNAKKYAYVSDYVRLYALKNQGGIYFDTDVEVRKSFDSLLEHRAFGSYEGKKLMGTGIIGAEQGHPWINALIDAYNDMVFLKEDGSYDTTPNSFLVSNMTRDKFGWKEEDTLQVLSEDLNIYPMVYLSAKDSHTGAILADDRTYSIHHFG